MRTMFDSVNPLSIPLGAQLVAGYVDGKYAWTEADWQRFPNAVRVGIACFPDTDNGHVLDVERGNATPGQAPGWVAMRRRAGCDPTVYCSLSAWGGLVDVFASSGIPAPHWWVADWTGQPHMPDGATACQYAANGVYDTSQVADYWPGVDNGQTWPAAPAPAAQTLPLSTVRQALGLMHQAQDLLQQAAELLDH